MHGHQRITVPNMPRMTVSDNNKNTRVSDAWIKKGDFFKLQNIQVGYTFDWGMRIYGSIENLFTISSYNKYGDPEIGTGRLNLVGYDSGRYPYQRTYKLWVLVYNFKK